MDPSALIDLVLQKKWLALTALLIGLVVRLLKSDTKIPLDVPPQWRVWLALGLGGASGVLDKLVRSGETSWREALTQGLLAAGIAIVSHSAVIGSLRGGREITVPGLTKKNTPPGPGKPPSLPPKAL